VRFAWIHAQRQLFDVAVMCELLAVSRQGYYAWQTRRRRPSSAIQVRRQQLMQQIRQAYEASDGTYGSPRVHAELVEENVVCCVNTVAKLMRRQGLRASVPRRFVPLTTDSRHDHPVFANRLRRDFSAELPNRKWVCDITYVSTDEGFLYLSAVMDLCSRKIVGWAMADHLRAELCLDALNRAIRTRSPEPGLLHHSDRGVQYACGEYQKQLRLLGIECSMSRVGNCYDNAAMESFWGTLKTEHVYRRQFRSREEAKGSIFLWIEGWYNRRRRHSALGYKSPEHFEASLN
jgi:transposase InsO family protein